MMSSFLIWGCVLKGCLREVYFEGPDHVLKGIEDFNLEHWQEVEASF